MRRALLLALTLLCGSAHAQGLVSNPLLFPSATLTTGNCLQATGPNTIATSAGPCGTATGSGNVDGPTSSTIGNLVVWGNATGTGVVNSAIPAASIPTLGGNNIWGGFNTFNARPVYDLGGTLATPWDDANLPSPLTTTVAASTYLTIADAAAQYLTQTGAATTYLSQTDAAAQYLTIANAAAQYLTQTAATAKYMPFAGGTFTGQVTFGASQSIAVAGTGPFTGTHYTTNNVLRFNLGVDTAEAGNNTGSNLHFYTYNDAGIFQGDALTITRATLAANFLNRPTWANLTPWDSGNFNPLLFLTKADAANTYTTPAEVDAALSGFLTQANAASTYLTQNGAAATYAPIANPTFTQAATFNSGPINISGSTSAFRAINFETNGSERWMMGADNIIESGGNAGSNFALFSFDDTGGVNHTVLTGNRNTGLVNFGTRPTFNGAVPWDSANFNPGSFTGTPYDISITYQGSSTPTTPYTAGTRLLQYVFTRKVVFPAGFAGSRVDCLHAPAATSQQINFVSSALGGLGGVTFTAGSTTGTFTNQPGGTMTFNPGDILTVTTATTSPAPDIALAGIFGTLQGSISP